MKALAPKPPAGAVWVSATSDSRVANTSSRSPPALPGPALFGGAPGLTVSGVAREISLMVMRLSG